MLSLDHFANLSPLKEISPKTKAAFSLITLVVCLFASNNIISLIVIAVMMFWCVFVGKTPFVFYAKMLLAPMLFLGLSVLGINRGIMFGLMLVLRSIGAVSCLYGLVLTTPMSDIIGLLKAVKVPNFAIEQLTLVYRFIFILLEIANTKYKVAQSRIGVKKRALTFKTVGVIIASIFVQSYLQAGNVYRAMRARGYSGQFNTLSQCKSAKGRQIALIVIFETALIVLTFLL